MTSRRAFLAASAAIVASAVRRARAEEIAVPIAVQAQLLAKVAAYDKNFAARAGARAQVLVVARAGNDQSGLAAKTMIKELGALSTIGGLAHDETLLTYANAGALAATCKQSRAAIVHLSSGFGDEVDAIRAALTGVDVLGSCAVADYVPRGIVLGFDLVSGKPKLLVHLAQAKKQGVAFKAEVLKLMRVFE